MADLSEIKELVEGMGDGIARVVERNKSYDARLLDIEKRMNRPGAQASEGFGQPTDAGFVVGTAGLPQWKKDFAHLLRTGEMKAGMQVGSDPDGGYITNPEFNAALQTLIRKASSIRGVASAIGINSGAAVFPVQTSGGEVNWVTETEARPNTASPQLGAIRTQVFEMYSNPRVTQTMLDDGSIDIAGFVVGNTAEDMALEEDRCFIEGDGVSQPRGFTTYPTAATADASRPWGTIEHIATGASGAWPTADADTYDLLVRAVFRLKPQLRSDAVWLMGTESIEKLRKIKTATDKMPIWTPSMTAGTPDLLLGYPVVEAEQMPAIAANSYSVAFGNFRRGYTIVDRVGMRVLVDPYSSKPWVSYHCHKRVGGGVTSFNALKLIRFSVS